MKNIYIVFDKLHSNEAGGLVSAYASLIQLLKDDYTIKVISIINSNLTRHDMFSDCEIVNVSKHDFFPRMEIISDSLKSFKLLLLLKELFKLLCYFCYIPISRIKMRNMFSSDDRLSSGQFGVRSILKAGTRKNITRMWGMDTGCSRGKGIRHAP